MGFLLKGVYEDKKQSMKMKVQVRNYIHHLLEDVAQNADLYIANQDVNTQT